MGMRLVIHALIVTLAFFPWLTGLIGFAAAWCLVILADMVWPQATWGNCWSFVGKMLYRHGGGMFIRPSKPYKIIPHAVWVPHMPPTVTVRQTRPLRPATKWWQILKTIYFEFRLVSREKHTPANWFDSTEVL